MGHLDTVYARLPVWAQHATVSAYGAYWYWLRFGGSYSRFLDEYLQRDSFTAAEWQRWQTARVRDLLRTAVTHVPYYQRTWTRDLKAAALAGRLDQLPLLDKEPLRVDPEAFLRQDISPKRRL